MDKERIAYLLEKYVERNLAPAEKEELYLLAMQGNESGVQEAIREWMEQDIQMTAEFETAPDADRRAEILVRVLTIDKARIQQPISLYRRPFYRQYWFAAACVAMAVMLLGFWKFNPGSKSEIQPVAITDPRVPVDFTRSLILPDGSSVVLKKGSTLQYPEKFSGTTREVTLNGEAYFDIRHINRDNDAEGSLPFIIHTGKVKTVVMGTSFNIRAYPEQQDIVVSVTKGKVRVEDDAGEILAVLTKNQQVVYNNKAGAEVLKAGTDVANAAGWIKSDMEFDGVSLENIALLLEKRYGMRIIFENPALKECLTVVSFSGTESLENVLETLCLIRNATYSRNEKDEIVINGNGCE